MQKVVIALAPVVMAAAVSCVDPVTEPDGDAGSARVQESVGTLAKRGTHKFSQLAHDQLCGDLKTISDGSSDQASDAYAKGNLKEARSAQQDANKAFDDAKSQGCSWAQ